MFYYLFCNSVCAIYTWLIDISMYRSLQSCMDSNSVVQRPSPIEKKTIFPYDARDSRHFKIQQTTCLLCVKFTKNVPFITPNSEPQDTTYTLQTFMKSRKYLSNVNICRFTLFKRTFRYHCYHIR